MKRRVDPRSASTKLSHWVGDELWGSDGLPADGVRRLQITELQWSAPDGRIHSVAAPVDGLVDADIRAVLAYGRRYGIGVSVWSESAALDRAMRLHQSWFPVGPVEDNHPDVSVTWGPPGCVEVTTGRQSGSFDKVLRALRRRTGGGERWSAALDGERLTIEYQPMSGEPWSRTWRRSDVIAVGDSVRSGSGIVVFASEDDTAVPRLSQRGHVDDAARRMRTAVHALNVALA